jgi:hypothetical protein
LFLYSESSTGTKVVNEKKIINSDDLLAEVNSWNNRRWNKSVYDSLSAAIQTTKVVKTEAERDNLQSILDGYYCNSMRLSFEDWKNAGDPNVQNSEILKLAVAMTEAVNNKQFRAIDYDILKPLIVEFNDIKSVSALSKQVLIEITKEFDSKVIDQLRKKINQLIVKSHIVQFPQLVNELNMNETRLIDFEDFTINFQVKRSRNAKASNYDLCNQLRSAFPEVDRYIFYNK